MMSVDLYSRTPPGLVPAENGSDNLFLRDVVGNRNDHSFSNGMTAPTVIGHLTAGYYHIHDSAKVWPTGTGDDADKGADPITLTSANGTEWLHGAKTQIVPADQIPVWFDIHWLVIGGAASADDYEIRVYKGLAEAEIEIGRVAFSRNAVQDRATVYIPIQIPPQHAGNRISASLACGAGNGATCNIKIYYHTYPDVTA
jgi:hypothetical protein